MTYNVHMFGRKSNSDVIVEVFALQQQAAGLANRAIGYLQQNNVAVARKDIQAAMKLAPSSLQVRSMAIAFYHNLNELEQALEIINGTTDQMIDQTDNLVEKFGYYNFSGRLFIAIKQDAQAVEQLKKALAIAKSNKYAEDLKFLVEAGVRDDSSPQPDIDEVKKLLALTIE